MIFSYSGQILTTSWIWKVLCIMNDVSEPVAKPTQTRSSQNWSLRHDCSTDCLKVITNHYSLDL